MQQITLYEEKLSYKITERLRLLRTNLLFCGVEKKVIMITSCLSGEGKTTISSDLSKSLTELNKKVLLIDIDMRRSGMTKQVVDGDKSVGLSHFLSGQCEFNDVLRQTTNAVNLFVVLAGAVPPNPTELLASERMKKMIDMCREEYDYIILDCPPLGMVVDASVMSQYCDGSILVISSGEIHYRMAQAVVEQLHSSNCPILGTVLNKVDDRSKGYYGNRYGGYYGGYYGNYKPK